MHIPSLLQQALDLQNSDKFEAAGELYQQILQAQPNHPQANHNMGTLAIQLGYAPASLDYFLRALEAAPDCAPYWLSYIRALLLLGEHDAARTVLQQAQQNGLAEEEVTRLSTELEGAPSSIEKDKLRELINQQKLSEALTYARELTLRYPQHVYAWQILGGILKQTGFMQEARIALQKVAELTPENADSHCNLGAALHDCAQHVAAETCLRRALSLQPQHVQALSNLGVVLQAQHRLPEAEQTLRLALQLNEHAADIHNNLGNVLKGLGRVTEAIHAYQKACLLDERYGIAWYNLGLIFAEQGQFSDAEMCTRHALLIMPDYAPALNTLAIIYKASGRLHEAEEYAQQALAITPDYQEALNNMGAICMAQDRYDEAAQYFRQVLQHNPKHALAHCNLGSVLMNINSYDVAQYEQALACFHTALQLKPDFSDAHSNWLFALNYHPTKSAEEIFTAYRDYDTHFGQVPHPQYTHRRHTHRRLRIAYVSPDFRHHACRFFLEPLLAHHDKNRFEIYAYAELTRQDDVTLRYKAYADHWLNTLGMSDDAVADCIRRDEIDILVELAGHTAGNRLAVFARKPAPVSLSWLGYGYTTGLSAIDYYLCDEICAPPGSEAVFSEHPWRMPAPMYCYRPAADMGEVNPLPALQNGYITLGCLSRSIRLNQRTIQVWCAILKKLPTAHLVLNNGSFSDSRMQRRWRELFMAQGIAAERLHIGRSSPPWDVLRSIDIGLDCFPHNSGTTLFETLYMGIPYITLAERPSVGLIGSSILHGIGHPEWIAQTEQEYISKTIILASDLSHLSKLRTELRQEMQHSPLMDETQFAKKVETAYLQMWQQHSDKNCHQSG